MLFSCMIKRSGRAVEHIHHNVFLASGKDETSILAMLDFSSQYGFYILLCVIAYLLKFVDGYDTRFISLF